MTQMMKVEWNPSPKQYRSMLLEHDEAWALYYSLADIGLTAGIESMSAWECEQYLKQQLDTAE
jgi:hypothetical protein